ncbi:MAG: DUF1127 domain-containing protein [Desulfuromonadales bacterium]|nr:DUF1127 domain-containing protein [Desulfuromonadales bacterium]
MKWFWKRLQHTLVLRQQRQQLLAMDERMRKDLAISRVDAEQFAGRYGPLEKMKPHGDKSWKK